ncbi:hypothetical protein CEXT_495741 [Caerostris extrusa]|uniref:Uncharacterized protein n=1 Tax=Caerostris extrusa TaxID=172846 RepID=A0AAV4RTQ2_CAEEX|nr:hypothetical protein CEXT_495741 [Caerostris extrusa]
MKNVHWLPGGRRFAVRFYLVLAGYYFGILPSFEFVQQTKAAKRKAFIFSSLSKNHMGTETNMLKAIRFENICKLLSRGNFWFLQRLKEGKSRVLVRLSDTGVRFAVPAYFQITRGG